MSTSSKPATPALAPYRPFDVTVAAVGQLSPHFTRITFAGADLDRFGDTCLDQRVKIVLPLPGAADPFGFLPREPDWYARWRDLPEHRRNPFRTYTVRAVRQAAREVDVDIVRHGEGGPASRWAGAARPGDPVVLVGPDARADSATVGVEWKPGHARTVLLVGDETAVPAMTSILESLPADVTGQAFLEVPTEADQLPVSAPAGVEVRWLPRGERSHGQHLRYAVRAHLEVVPAGAPVGACLSGTASGADTSGSRRAPARGSAAFEDIDVDAEMLWETPEPAAGTAAGEQGAFAWLAGEAKTIADLRRHLVRERAWPRRQVAFMGYWRAGRAEV